jgi:hypothetical protein
MGDATVQLVEPLLVRMFRDQAFQLLHARLKDTAAFVKAASQEPGGPPDTPTQVLRLWAATLGTAIPQLPMSVHKDVATAMRAAIPNLHDLLQRVFLCHARTLLAQDVHGRVVHDLRVLPITVEAAFQAFLNKLATQDEVRLGTALTSPTVRDTVARNVFRDMLAAEVMQGRVTVLPRKDPPPHAQSQVVATRPQAAPAPLPRYASAVNTARHSGGRSSGSVSVAHGPVPLLPPLLPPPASPTPDADADAGAGAAATAPSPVSPAPSTPTSAGTASPPASPAGPSGPPPRGASLVPSVAPAKALLSNAPKEAATSVISAVTAMSAAGGMVQRAASVAPAPRATGGFASVLGKTVSQGSSTLLMQRLAAVRPQPGTFAVTPGDSASQVTSMGMRHRQEMQTSDATSVHRRHLATVGAEVRELPGGGGGGGNGGAPVVPIGGPGPRVPARFAPSSTISEQSEGGSSSDGSATS